MKIKQTRNTLSQTYLDAMKIRQSVFVQDQGIPLAIERDSKEALCLYFVLYDSQKPIATCRLLPDKKLKIVTLQRMAVLRAYQRQGIGETLLLFVLNFCKEQNFKTVNLHAQKNALPFYQKLGFRIIGESFQEAGISHFPMTKEC